MDDDPDPGEMVYRGAFYDGYQAALEDVDNLIHIEPESILLRLRERLGRLFAWKERGSIQGDDPDDGLPPS